ncbi:MAG TPA: MscL family protein [Candidatus Saccharimonadales bacterium]|nr:MscL family protein [Candidatus Saccharimonadales bacterium]
MMAEKQTTDKKARAQVIRTQAAIIKGRSDGFFTFVREQGVVGLAVGLAIGAAAGAAVKQIVDGLINPIVGFLIGGVDLSQITWVVVRANEQGRGGLELSTGAVLSALITLIATALVVYAVVHGAKLDRLDKKKQ